MSGAALIPRERSILNDAIYIFLVVLLALSLYTGLTRVLRGPTLL